VVNLAAPAVTAYETTRSLFALSRLALVAASSERHVVLGAAGGTGSAVVRELVDRGLRVRAVTRGGKVEVPEGVEQAAADVGTTEGARRACEDAAVVYHCVQPNYRKWPELFPPITQAVLEGAATASAKLVFADNLYLYGPAEGPMTEETPQRAESRKGRTRIEMAEAILRAHAEGSCDARSVAPPTTTARAAPARPPATTS
jgi:nucleoside-diphosphate-sugar epimerase